MTDQIFSDLSFFFKYKFFFPNARSRNEATMALYQNRPYSTHSRCRFVVEGVAAAAADAQDR